MEYGIQAGPGKHARRKTEKGKVNELENPMLSK